MEEHVDHVERQPSQEEEVDPGEFRRMGPHAKRHGALPLFIATMTLQRAQKGPAVDSWFWQS